MPATAPNCYSITDLCVLIKRNSENLQAMQSLQLNDHESRQMLEESYRSAIDMYKRQARLLIEHYGFENVLTEILNTNL